MRITQKLNPLFSCKISTDKNHINCPKLRDSDQSLYNQKHTPEDSGDIESFHNSLKTDYIWPNDLETFKDAGKLMEYAFNDYNSVRPHSSIEYLQPDEFERRMLEDDGFRDKFLEDRKRKARKE